LSGGGGSQEVDGAGDVGKLIVKGELRQAVGGQLGDDVHGEIGQMAGMIPSAAAEIHEKNNKWIRVMRRRVKNSGGCGRSLGYGRDLFRCV
jgi:hypothetical protein